MPCPCQQASKWSLSVSQLSARKQAIKSWQKWINWHLSDWYIDSCQNESNWKPVCNQVIHWQLSRNKQLTIYMSTRKQFTDVKKQAIDNFLVVSCQQASTGQLSDWRLSKSKAMWDHEKTNIAPFKVFTCLGCCKVKNGGCYKIKQPAFGLGWWRKV